MDASRFDAIVKKRADQRVQTKIKQFKTDLNNAVKTLTGLNEAYPWRIIQNKVNAKAINAMLHENGKWPRSIWDDEEKQVTKELLSTLDEMQLALLSLNLPEEPNQAVPDTGEE